MPGAVPDAENTAEREAKVRGQGDAYLLVFRSLIQMQKTAREWCVYPGEAQHTAALRLDCNERT